MTNKEIIIKKKRAHTQVALQFLNILTIAASALMIWKGIAVVTNTESPIVVVLR